MSHDHITNGIAPVKGCKVCELLIKAARKDRRPEGFMPPWLWLNDQEDK